MAVRMGWTGLVCGVLLAVGAGVGSMPDAQAGGGSGRHVPGWIQLSDRIAQTRRVILRRLDAEFIAAGTHRDSAEVRVRNRVEDRLMSAERRLRRAEGKPDPEASTEAVAQLEAIEDDLDLPEVGVLDAEAAAVPASGVALADAIAADIGGPGGTADRVLARSVAPFAQPAPEAPAHPPVTQRPRTLPEDAAAAPAGATPAEAPEPPDVAAPGVVRTVEAPPPTRAGARIPARISRSISAAAVGCALALMVAAAAVRIKRGRRHLTEVMG